MISIQLSMGLSISDSAAERQRIQQLSLKQIRIASQSQARSQSRNHDPIVTPEYDHTASPLKKDLKEAEQTQIKKIPKWKDKMGTAVEDSVIENQQQLPSITVNPPPSSHSYYPQQTKYNEALQKDKIVPMAYQKPAQSPQYLPIKETEKVQVQPNDVFRKEGNMREYFQPSPVKLGVQNLTESISPSRPKTQVDEKSILASGSRTLNLKKTIQGLDDPIVDQRGSLDVQFQNFDWRIPRPKVEQEIVLTRRLKPQASVVLISKPGQEETGEQSGQRKWKNRRQLMKEIVNDRLESVETFSLPNCNPNGFESIHHFCK